MAYLLQDEDDDQNQQGQQIAGPQGSQVFGGGQENQNQGNQNQYSGSQAGGGFSSSQSPQGYSQGAPQKNSDNKGTGFVNVSDYINQNKNQSQNLANQAAGKITEKIDTAKTGVNERANSFQDMVQQNTVNLNQDVANRAAENPYEFSQNQGDVDQFKNMHSGQYKGPQSFETQDNYQDILQNINSAKDYAGLANSESGRTEILKSMQRNPTKSSGMAALDNLLLQTNEGANQTLQDASAGAFDLDGFLSSISGQQNQGVQAAKDTSAQTAKDLQNQFVGQGGVYDQFVGGLDQRVTDARSGADGTTQSILDALSSGNITQEQAEMLGLNEEQFTGANQNLSSLNSLNDFFKSKGLLDESYTKNDLSGYLNQNQTSDAALHRQNVGTQDDYLRMQALSDLLGVDNNILQDNDQLGTGSQDLVDFDLNNFMSDYGQTLSSRQSADERYKMLENEWNKVKGDSFKDKQKRGYAGITANNFNEYLKQRGFSVTDPSLKKIKPQTHGVPSLAM